MELEYYFGETMTSFGEDWTYDIDLEQMQNFYINNEINYFVKTNNIKDQEKIDLLKAFMKYHIYYVDDKEIERYCKENYDELKDYFEKKAYREWKDYNDN